MHLLSAMLFPIPNMECNTYYPMIGTVHSLLCLVLPLPRKERHKRQIISRPEKRSWRVSEQVAQIGRGHTALITTIGGVRLDFFYGRKKLPPSLKVV